MTLQTPARTRRPRGGRRPGAGAPKGNLNALKHGVHSRQIEQLGLALSLIPETRKALARLMKRQRRQQAQAQKVAVSILTNLLRASLQALDSDSARNNQPISGTVTLIPNSHRPARRRKTPNVNQTPQPNRPDQSM